MMHPVLLRIGPVTIYSFGLLLLLAAIVTLFSIWREARHRAYPEEKVIDVFLLSLFAFLIFGRLAYVFSHWPFFVKDFARIVFMSHYPGFSFSRALLAAFVSLAALAGVYRLEVMVLLDMLSLALAFSFPLALAGCFLDGCLAPGTISFLLVGIFVFLAVLLSFLNRSLAHFPSLAGLRSRPGLLFLTYLIFTAVSFLILFWWEDKRVDLFYLSLLVASLGVFALRYWGLFKMIKFPKNLLVDIGQYLENRRRDIEHRLLELKKEDPFEDKSRILDRASDDTEAQSKAGHERVAALSQQLNLALIQTRKALATIKIGKYGVCESCGKMIDTDRLAAMPTATLCLSCEKKRER